MVVVVVVGPPCVTGLGSLPCPALLCLALPCLALPCLVSTLACLYPALSSSWVHICCHSTCGVLFLFNLLPCDMWSKCFNLWWRSAVSVIYRIDQSFESVSQSVSPLINIDALAKVCVLAASLLPHNISAKIILLIRILNQKLLKTGSSFNLVFFLLLFSVFFFPTYLTSLWFLLGVPAFNTSGGFILLVSGDGGGV